MPTLAILIAAAQAVAAPAPFSSGACLGVDAVLPQETRTPGDRRPGSPFSAAQTLDLELQVRMRPTLGEHVLQLRLFTPRGYLYQTMTAPFRFHAPRPTGADSDSAASMRVAGFPRPLRVQSLERSTPQRPAADRVTARLPLAGTSIVLGSLFGRWTAVPYLDDAAAPCGRSGSFVIAE